MHFTEDPGKVPEKIRKKARRESEVESAPEEAPASKSGAARAPETTPQSVSGGEGLNGTDDREYDQVQKELVDREAAMMAVRKRIDEVAALLNKFTGSWDEQKKLMIEHNSLSAQFKEMKAQYNKQVEIARKAGLQINIQQ